jgi:hypothetical protein
MFDNVASEPLIVSVLDELLIVLFVKTCEPVSVATVLSMLNVTVLSVTTDVIPVPPAKLNVSDC